MPRYSEERKQAILSKLQPPSNMMNRPGYIGGNFFESECMIRIYKINHYMSDRIVSIRRQINN